MEDRITYQIDKSELYIQKMEFSIINRRPMFSKRDQETARNKAEKQLFHVFVKYTDSIDILPDEA